MTTNKSKKGFVESRAEPMKEAWRTEYRQAPRSAEFRYTNHGTEFSHEEFEYIKPKSRSGSDNIPYPKNFGRKPLTKKAKLG